MGKLVTFITAVLTRVAISYTIKDIDNANHETFISGTFRSETRPPLVETRPRTCGPRFISSKIEGEWWNFTDFRHMLIC